MLTLPLLATLMLTSPTDFTAATKDFHVQREKRLTADDGWLTLVGLEWLAEGANAGVPLPPPAPQQAGVWTRTGSTASFTPARGVAVTLSGKPFAGGALRTDADGEPDVLDFHGVHVFAIVRGDRVGLRMKDPHAPARKAFHGIPVFPIDARWRIDATWEAAPMTLEVPNVLGQIERQPSPGVAVFQVAGTTYKLRPIAEDDGKLFFIFGDATNRTESYGAGRFLYADPPRDGRVLLDFNRALNPPCAFSSFATCPIPPAGNKLSLPIPAGEKRYGEH
jgi:uncharacterized protein (DUF1684 family)